mmetsp:Transcript_61752/g.143684  ORF Transcript_61752/g.143684 Transcript_61752/m.143684 type:complete len:95 (-) Transcript_61752:52-336(-)
MIQGIARPALPHKRSTEKKQSVPQGQRREQVLQVVAQRAQGAEYLDIVSPHKPNPTDHQTCSFQRISRSDLLSHKGRLNFCTLWQSKLSPKAAA